MAKKTKRVGHLENGSFEKRPPADFVHERRVPIGNGDGTHTHGHLAVTKSLQCAFAGAVRGGGQLRRSGQSGEGFCHSNGGHGRPDFRNKRPAKTPDGQRSKVRQLTGSQVFSFWGIVARKLNLALVKSMKQIHHLK